MSANKNRFYDVTTIMTVSAPNMETAKLIAQGSQISGTRVLSTVTDVERVSAQEAHEWSALMNS